MHYIEKCKGCGIVLSQCRCPAQDKTVQWGECKAWPECGAQALRRGTRNTVTREEAAARYPERQQNISESAPLTTIIDVVEAVGEAVGYQRVKDWQPTCFVCGANVPNLGMKTAYRCDECIANNRKLPPAKPKVSK